ncbi:IS1182 family transposase [Noviherbaspirillum galbum]|uniref:IS1182 family transposase n=1 Tax=Noviherbaspirillum galbum TaxID=2709383 RepID=A0A6B3SN41_9BURK|nr:IS1182 family transposase [Noviherbaspirillum galbum]NEX60176.1 IS1182 family transposase [Noviherbaspirillum galbum]
MKRFIEGVERTQGTMFPAQLDEYVAEDNPVRVVDAFIDTLDLKSLGFDGAVPAETGRPSYHPAVMLKIYLYGYLNRIQSSRRLERETQRNVELMWLINRLTPDFKTIADFRKDNGTAIRNVCRQFVLLCHKLNMFEGGEVAIDGSKFKAVNNRDKNYTQRKIKARIEQVEESIARYMEELDRADRQPELTTKMRVQHIKDKIASFKRQIDDFNALEKQLQQVPDQQISESDPDARSMATSGRGTGMVGYNVQTAVDTKHHLIVAHEVTNVGHDRSQLANMTEHVQQVIEKKGLVAIADRGYFSGVEIRACELQGAVPLVPKPITSNNRALGKFDKRDFIYMAQSDEYLCPAGQRAPWRCQTEERGELLHKYWPSACPTCTLKPKCTTGDYRRITRWEHEEILERMQRRLDERPGLAITRRCTVEHPFGTLKAWMGATHFLMKRLPNVATEMSLHVLAYNLKRMINILGPNTLMAAMRR